MKTCESCNEHYATTRSTNPDWSGYNLCAECAAEYDARPPVGIVQAVRERVEYRVSDGVESEYFTAANPEDALHQMFSQYDWGDCPELQEENCQTASSRYTVWQQTDDGEIEVLSGPLSDVRR